MNQEQDSQSQSSHIKQSQETNEFESNQFEFNESIDDEKFALKQLLQQHSNQIQDYFQKLKGDVQKNTIKKFVEKQLKLFSQDVEKKLEQLFERLISEKEIQIAQIQQEKNQKDQEILELTQKYNEVNNSLMLGSYNDNNICLKITQINQLLERTCQTTIQASQQLDNQSLDQMQQQIQMIRESITGDTETQINNLQKQLQDKDTLIKQLQKEKTELQNQQKNNNSSIILMKKIEEIIQQYQNQCNQADLINKKTNQIVEINKELNKLNTLISNENEKLKSQFEEEKNKTVQKQLEGCFKLQDRSLLYIQLGLKIFQQYYRSHIQDDKNIQSQIARLNKFHQNYLKKENFKLINLGDIEQFYIKQEFELKSLFDESLKEYKNLINEITQRRIPFNA
ncbi:unnamed protein product [Paramecium octaurelia]|uniref:Uncharacterized protein n=1 Tax=Paramecium octaurelia TaxID=43137 RepID=A0A8S1SQ75_PAROT|nr:unnamed protein product [Paramecium octaurelia]